MKLPCPVKERFVPPRFPLQLSCLGGCLGRLPPLVGGAPQPGRGSSRGQGGAAAGRAMRPPPQPVELATMPSANLVASTLLQATRRLHVHGAATRASAAPRWLAATWPSQIDSHELDASAVVASRALEYPSRGAVGRAGPFGAAILLAVPFRSAAPARPTRRRLNSAADIFKPHASHENVPRRRQARVRLLTPRAIVTIDKDRIGHVLHADPAVGDV